MNAETESVNEHKYLLTIVKQMSQRTTQIPVRTKGEAHDERLEYVTCFEGQADQKLEILDSNRSSEFHKSIKFLKRQGLNTSHTTTYKP